jgi:hypothetical protein
MESACRRFSSLCWSLQSEHFDSCSLATPPVSHHGCSVKAAPNSFLRSELSGPGAGPNPCRAVCPAPSKLMRSPRRPFKIQWLALRGAGPFVASSTPGQPRSRVASSDLQGIQPKPCQGLIQACEVGNLSARVRRGRGVPNVWFLAATLLALLLCCLRSAASSPARSAWLRHGSGMVDFSRW